MSEESEEDIKSKQKISKKSRSKSRSKSKSKSKDKKKKKVKSKAQLTLECFGIKSDIDNPSIKTYHKIPPNNIYFKFNLLINGRKISQKKKNRQNV